MRTILRFETPCGKGPCIGSTSYAVGCWFSTHYSKMECASSILPGFDHQHLCAVDERGAPYWLNGECLRDAEAAGLVLHVLTVSECLDEDPERFYGRPNGDMTNEQGQPCEWQVGFDPAHVISRRVIKPTEYRHAVHPA